jgi:limonene-1,2-epoxide hydrolase
MSREDCLRAVHDYKRAWESQDPRAMTDIFDSEGVFVDPRHPPFKGHEAIFRWYEHALANFTDPEVEYTRVVIDPPYAVAEWVSRLSHGDQRFAYHGLSLFEVRSGKVVYQRDYFDTSESAAIAG